jgi:hypothetical protein
MANLCGRSAEGVDLSGGPAAGCAPSGIRRQRREQRRMPSSQSKSVCELSRSSAGPCSRRRIHAGQYLHPACWLDCVIRSW